MSEVSYIMKLLDGAEVEWKALGELAEYSPSLVAERHFQISPMDPVIRNFRITADPGKPNETDHVLAHPPFNHSDTALRACAFPRSGATMQLVSAAKDHFRKDDDVRWQPSGARQTAKGNSQGERGGVHQFGVPPMTALRGSAFPKSEGTPQVASEARNNNANFAWVQHFIHCIRRSLGEGGHLAPQGMAGFVLANGSMSSNQSGEGDIRRALIEADLVDCMVALPGQLFYSTQIPVCLWFLAKNKAADAKRGFRDRRKQTLFIDARKLGTLIDRVHRELTDADLEKITTTYHAWRGDSSTSHFSLGTSHSTSPPYSDVPGFCFSATTAQIAAHGHVLTPGRYVGAEEVEDDGDPFEEKMPRLVAELNAQFAESAKLETAIRKNLQGLGYAL